MNGVQPVSDALSAASMLAWWRDAGLDVFVENEPQPWIGRAAVTEKPAPPKPDALPDTLDAFAAWLRDSADIPEAGPSARRVMPSGSAGLPLMVMVDMPEMKDHEAGHLLAGDVGVLFDRMLAAIGLDRVSVYLAALCPGRPATGQLGEEHLSGLGKLARHHIALAAPKRVWLLGQSTSRAVLGVDAAAARGKKHYINQDVGNVETVVSLHPRLLLQNPQRKAGVWADMQMLIKGIDG